MKFHHSLISSLFLALSLSCQFDKVELGIDNLCQKHGKTVPPSGYSLMNIGSIPLSSGKILLMQFPDEKTGYALGRTFSFADAKCFKTSNGGKLWTRLSFNTSHVPKGMIFFNASIGIITLEDPHGCPSNCPAKCITLRTLDGGDHWEEYFVPNLSGSLSHLQLDSLGNVYAFLQNNFNYTIMKSEDQGMHWENLEINPAIDFEDDLLKLVNDRIYIINTSESLLELDTEGRLLKEINTGSMVPIDFEIPDKDHFIMADRNRTIRSTDGGGTWETIYDREARIIGFSSITNGLAILNKINCPREYYRANDVIASTIDGGQSWMESEYTSDILQDYILSARISADHYVLLLGEFVYELKSN